MEEVPVQPQPQVTPQKTNWKKIGLTILIILVVTSIIASVYWFFIFERGSFNSDLKEVPKSQVPTSTPSTTTSAEKDETADWKSHSTEDFSFKYPSEWSSAPASTGGFANFADSENKILISVNEHTYINPQDTPENLAKKAAGSRQILNKKEIVVDGHKGIYQEINSEESYDIDTHIGGVKQITNFSEQDGGPRLTSGTQRITLFIYDKENIKEYRDIMNLILSTLTYLK
ncbi:hypothetical protein IID23_00825 [Patescibacteria group bacterium]|nr:hypothetical protein [Patescibacteria group bacterium]